MRRPEAYAKLTAERLRALVHYEPSTGTFFRKSTTGSRAQAGSVAGCRSPFGYVVMSVDGCMWEAHRLAWLYVHGEWPAGQIDHINGDPGDNSITNLRDVPARMNSQNKRRLEKRNRTGRTGVYPSALGFYAAITWTAEDGVRRFKRLGNYERLEDASDAFLAAKRELHPGHTLDVAGEPK